MLNNNWNPANAGIDPMQRGEQPQFFISENTYQISLT
jgi:hypothetical protein